MPRVGKRHKVAKNVYMDSGGYEVRVQRQGVTYSARFPLDTDLETLKKELRALKSQADTEHPPASRGTLSADAPIYLKRVRTLASIKQIRAHVKAWCARVGHVQRRHITRADVLDARAAWQEEGLAPKTINNRVATLRHLYRILDGPTAKAPSDGVKDLRVPKTPIIRVTEDTILLIDLRLQQREKEHGTQLTPATRARFRVLVSTGRRPSEIMRAQPSDVDLERRVWVVRDGKGGFSPGLYLNDDMLAAWQLFVDSNAWGKYHGETFTKTIRRYGWPADVRPYNARHSTWITASERGADLADIAAGAGHKDIRMTRKAYVPILNSRMQQLSETLEGRFKGWSLVPKSGPGRKLLKTGTK